jgi:hypothetical protein
MIINAFEKGVVKAGATVETYNLANKKQWEDIKNFFISNENIVFALPLYIETPPGILLEFLEELSICLENDSNSSFVDKRVSFILQSAFPEACQRRCCENYLKTIPKFLNSSFAGILSHGDTFNLSFVESTKMNTLASYELMGQKFVENNATFFFKECLDFTGPEYFSEAEAKKYNRLLKFFCQHIAEGKGCTGRLTDAPYEIK